MGLLIKFFFCMSVLILFMFDGLLMVEGMVIDLLVVIWCSSFWSILFDWVLGKWLMMMVCLKYVIGLILLWICWIKFCLSVCLLMVMLFFSSIKLIGNCFFNVLWMFIILYLVMVGCFVRIFFILLVDNWCLVMFMILLVWFIINM